MKKRQALISARVTLENLLTNGKPKFDNNNDDSKGNYSNSCGNTNDNNNEYNIVIIMITMMLTFAKAQLSLRCKTHKIVLLNFFSFKVQKI